MLRIVIPIRNCLDVPNENLNPDIPIIVWLCENVGPIYNREDFRRYWRGNNWNILISDSEHIVINFYYLLSTELHTEIMLRWG